MIIETKRQLREFGYSKTTIRSVAKECNIAIGTVYNYFDSKETLIASFMLDEWIECYLKIQDNIKREENLNAFKIIYDELVEFYNSHIYLFSDKEATNAYYSNTQNKHKVFRTQISNLIKIKYNHLDQFSLDFISESLITWTLAGTEFSTLYNVIIKLI